MKSSCLFFSWETGNNIIAEEEGFLKSLGPDPDQEGEELNAQVQQGSYSYTAPDGQLISVHYTADEKGFHPSGDHLPTPPPVSPEVQKGLDLIYAGIRAQQVKFSQLQYATSYKPVFRGLQILIYFFFSNCRKLMLKIPRKTRNSVNKQIGLRVEINVCDSTSFFRL